MTRSKLSTKAILLAGGIGLSVAAFAGSQPAAAQTYPDTCPAGTVYDPTYGCTLSGQADFAYDGYPYGGYGLYGHHRELGHGFAHGIGGDFNHGAGVTVLRGSPSRGLDRLGGDGFNHGIAGDFGHAGRGIGFAHFGGDGFGHGIGGLDHGIGRGVGAAHFAGGSFGHGIGGGFHGGGGFGGGFHGGGFGGGGHR